MGHRAAAPAADVAGEASVATAEAPHAEAGASQTVRAQMRLRALILAGALAPGSRVPELALVERLGMSRTPIRMALVRLQEEGLLDALPGGGFAVRAFSIGDLHDAIELRGTLEGLAARLAAERGVGAALLSELRDGLAAVDALLDAPALDDDALPTYALHNGRFHQLLAAAAGSALVQRQVERATTLPFASPNGFVLQRARGPRARDHLLVAHAQHHAVVEAIVAREGARAESLMREHARLAHGNLREALGKPHGLQQVPGAPLLRRTPA